MAFTGVEIVRCPLCFFALRKIHVRLEVIYENLQAALRSGEKGAEMHPPMSSALTRTEFTCGRCRAEVHPGRGDFYVIRVEAFADPTPPEFTDEDLTRDHRREIKDLISRLDGLSEQDLLDQVYRRLNLILCGRCYADWFEHPFGEVQRRSP